MELMQINGSALEVQRIDSPTGAGQRAALVFLHEGLGSVSMWRDWPARLCARLGRVGVVYSRRGYGRSAPIPDVRGAGRHGPDYMHREAFETLPALLAALGLRAPLLVGHSDGATIALLHASRHPVAGCVAMAPHVMVEDVSIRSITAAREAFSGGSLRERLTRHHADVDNAFWQWNDVWLSDAFRAFDIRSDCARIRAPLLLVQGEDDEYGTMAQIDEIATRVPHARSVKLPRCGHSPQRDQPEATADAIEAFAQALP